MTQRIDALAIVTDRNETLWVRSGTFPLRQALESLSALRVTQPGPLYLLQSVTDEHGKELFARYVSPDYCQVLEQSAEQPQAWVAEIWHKTEPSFFASSTGVANRADFEHRADVILADAATLDDVLEAAYGFSQNIFHPWNPAKGSRSTSVGDVVVLRRGDEVQAHEVASCGFAPVQFN